jgi:hypothetical protein
MLLAFDPAGQMEGFFAEIANPPHRRRHGPS